MDMTSSTLMVKDDLNSKDKGLGTVDGIEAYTPSAGIAAYAPSEVTVAYDPVAFSPTIDRSALSGESDKPNHRACMLHA